MINQIIWSPGITLDAMERQIIEHALTFYRGNKAMTAKSLGVVVGTLNNKLERYEVEDDVLREKNDERQRKYKEQLARARGESPSQKDDKSAEKLSSESSPKPSEDVAEKSAMPVSEPKKVQEVLPEQTTNLRFKKRG